MRDAPAVAVVSKNSGGISFGVRVMNGRMKKSG
jgi:hypothetical protein